MSITSAVIWLIVISAVSVAVTVYDKVVSQKSRKGRIPEKALFSFAILGGSVAMYLTMLFISHKTRHKRFMLGIPAVILLQYCLIFYFFRLRG